MKVSGLPARPDCGWETSPTQNWHRFVARSVLLSPVGAANVEADLRSPDLNRRKRAISNLRTRSSPLARDRTIRPGGKVGLLCAAGGHHHHE